MKSARVQGEFSDIRTKHPSRTMYYVYLLECADKSIYTGITNDLKSRLKKHKDGTGSRYTRAKRAVKILYTEEQPTRGAALKREAEIKRLRREQKLRLISGARGLCFSIATG